MYKLVILLMAFLLFVIIFAVSLYVSIKHHFVEKNMSEDYDIGDEDEEDNIDENNEEVDFNLIETIDKNDVEDESDANTEKEDKKKNK